MRIWLVIVVGYWQCVWKKIVSVFVFFVFLVHQILHYKNDRLFCMIGR